MNRSGDANRVTVSAEGRNTPVRDAFHARLKQLTELSGRTQGWVAARFNERTGEALTSATVGRWINGHREPTLDDIAVLADIFEVPRGWFAMGEETPARRAEPMPARRDLPEDALETRDQVRAAKRRRDQQAG